MGLLTRFKGSPWELVVKLLTNDMSNWMINDPSPLSISKERWSQDESQETGSNTAA